MQSKTPETPTTIQKLKANLWMVALVLAVVALMGNALMAVRFIQRQSEQSVMAFELETTQGTLDRIGNPQSKATKLQSAKAELESLQSMFPSRLRGPDTVSTLIYLAEQNGMKVTNIESQPGEEEEIGDSTYRALSIRIQLEGTLSDLRGFLSEIEDEVSAASKLDKLSILDLALLDQAAPDSSPDGESSSEDEYWLEASLQMSVFARNNLNIQEEATTTSDPPEASNR